METITEIIVKENDIDELEHVNNSVYLNYLEKARGDWYSQAGMSFKQMKERSLTTVVLKIEITYLKEAKLGDLLKVKTSPVKLGTKSFVQQQDIYNQRDEKVVESTVTNVMMNWGAKQSIPVVEEIARFFK